VALMLERLGYEVINHPAAHDLIVTKLDSKLAVQKHIVTCADPANIDPTGTPELGRLVEAIMQHGAHSGFYVTARSFTQQARDYAQTMPQTIRLVDGAELEKSMRTSLAGVQLPIRYDAMCTQCGDTVKHKLEVPGGPYGLTDDRSRRHRAERLPRRGQAPWPRTAIQQRLGTQATAGAVTLSAGFVCAP
jgi:Restriction endonuclease